MYKMKRSIIRHFQIISVILLLTGCGQEQASLTYEIQSKPEEVVDEFLGKQIESTEENLTSTEVVQTDDIESVEDKRREEILATREAIITIAGSGSGAASYVQKTVDNFNNAQDRYWIEVQTTSPRQILLDISRGQGADIYFTNHLDIEALAEKGVFEDLTPYFESSNVVSLDDLVESVRRVGTRGEKFFYVVPRFQPAFCLVPKGSTEGGAWNLEGFYALAERYPDGMMNTNISKDPGQLLRLHLSYVIDDFIDWGNKTCYFNSEEFIKLLEEIKGYSRKNYSSLTGLTLAEQLEQNLLLVEWFSLSWDRNMENYKSMRDSVLEFCEVAGFPNEDTIVKYDMSHQQMFAINAGSENKEIAWEFIEYILSEEYQTEVQTGIIKDMYFPARVDVLEAALNAEITEYRDENVYYKNKFTDEQMHGVGAFTEEDKQFILDLVNNCYCDGAMHSANISTIINEEVNYFFQGTKTAKEVAEVIQSRVSLYLME